MEQADRGGSLSHHLDDGLCDTCHSLCSMDYIPSTSAIDTSRITVDPDTKAMLEKLELNISVQVRSGYRPRRRQEA